MAMTVKTVRLRPALGCVLNSDQQGLLGNSPNGHGYSRKPGCSKVKYFLKGGALFFIVTLLAVWTLSPEAEPVNHRRLMTREQQERLATIREDLANLNSQLTKCLRDVTRIVKTIRSSKYPFTKQTYRNSLRKKEDDHAAIQRRVIGLEARLKKLMSEQHATSPNARFRDDDLISQHSHVPHEDMEWNNTVEYLQRESDKELEGAFEWFDAARKLDENYNTIRTMESWISDGAFGELAVITEVFSQSS